MTTSALCSPCLTATGVCGVHCFAGCSAGDVYAAIRRRGHKLLGLGDTAPQPVKGSSEYERRQHEKAAWLWGRRKPIAGCRGTLPARGAPYQPCALPATLGFLPPFRREHHPALISAFAIVDEPEPGLVGTPSDVRSVHLTLLKERWSGRSNAHASGPTSSSSVPAQSRDAVIAADRSRTAERSDGDGDKRRRRGRTDRTSGSGALRLGSRIPRRSSRQRSLRTSPTTSRRSRSTGTATTPAAPVPTISRGRLNVAAAASKSEWRGCHEA